MIGLIFAQSGNGFIGKDGKLLFSIPADIKQFKELTNGKVVVMGRKTWLDLPTKFRPLPNRKNIVLTSVDTKDNPQYSGAFIVRSIEQAISATKDDSDIWFIGGEAVYREGMKYADVIHQTLVFKNYDGDARAPSIPKDKWVTNLSNPIMEHEGLFYQFNVYNRIKS